MSPAPKNLSTRQHLEPPGLIGGLVALWLCSAAPALAQPEGWQSGTVDDDKISVKYRISERTNETGDQVPLIEYLATATTTAHLALPRCIALLTDIAKHKDFMGDKVSKQVAALSDTEWVVYSYYAAPGPFPDNDRVTRMKRTEDVAGKGTVFTFSAAPTLAEPSKVKRVTHYKAVYTLRDLGDGKVELTTLVTMSPPSSAPLWIIRAAFPGAGANILRKMLELAGSPK